MNRNGAATKTLAELQAEIDAYQRAGGWTAVIREAHELWYRLQGWTPPQAFKRIKWFWQRGRRGWSERDAWNFSYYLAGVIAGGLREMAHQPTGYPTEMLPYDRRFAGDITDRESDAAMAAWQATLMEMSEGFRRWAADDWTMELEGDAIAEGLDDSLELFRRWFRDLWD